MDIRQVLRVPNNEKISLVNIMFTDYKFDFSEPSGGWWQEFEIAYLDSDSLEIKVFDYVEGKKDLKGSGVVINFTKIEQ